MSETMRTFPVTEVPATSIGSPNFQLVRGFGVSSFRVLPEDKTDQALKQLRETNPHIRYELARNGNIIRISGYTFRDFGLKLQAMRLSHAYPTRNVAELLGYKRPTMISKMEKGEVGVSNVQLQKLSSFFEVSPLYWITDGVPIFADDKALKLLLKRDSKLILRIDEFDNRWGVTQ